MLFDCAYMLVSHGSRDIRAQWAVKKLAEQVSERLTNHNIQLTGISDKPNLNNQLARSNSKTSVIDTAITLQSNIYSPLLETGTLELAALPLHQQIQQFSTKARLAGCTEIKVLPLFLLPGVHTIEDMCIEIVKAQAIVGNAIAIKQLPYLGNDTALNQLWANRLVGVEADAKILLSHGTKRAGGNQKVEQLAEQLQAMVAHLSVSPTLATQVETLIVKGKRRINIQPYLLFEGRIMSAIAREVINLQKRFPQAQFLLAQPLGATAELANLIVKGMLTP